MKNFTKSIIAGIVATLIMSIFMMIAAMIGMPKMSPPEMLSGMMGASIVVGWILHFVIGIIFALMYVYIISSWLIKIGNIVLKGVVFGIIAFVIAQVSMALMGMVMDVPQPDGNIILLAIGSLVGHIVFGIIVALIAKK
ncbi:DUF6789 family protein [Rasiella sp. SM2506]|uniref:DUF6789 family protein n=1 Tax=Rasiella sp. SM2506 TaxID=3423914 RepID=UPI003D7AA616